MRAMSQQIQAIYENGVLRPLEPLRLPEHQRVRISINGIVSDSDDLLARQRAAIVDLDAQLAELPDGGRSESIPVSEIDRTLYGRPE
jgi:predicted DNA-binding antitoxin AbrB/MazE fold protein